MFIRLISLIFIFAFGAGITPFSGSKANSASLIRDAEIEKTIRAYATPILSAAGLNPNSVKIFIVNDKGLNAFVAGGQNIFLNTGLIMNADSASQVIGVIAHETGHIAGGHLIRASKALKDSAGQSLLGYILGGAAVLAGRPDVGAAVISGAQQVGLRNYLTFSRTQEATADRSAVRYLDATRQSGRGLLQFMEILGEQELLSERQQDPYVRTHPLSRDRISFLQNHVAKSPNSARPPNHDFERQFQRMKSKLIGFTLDYGRVLKNYPESDRTLPARYARAIAEYRRSRAAEAVAMVDELINENPDDAYFYEIKGQILFENGQGDIAIPAYQKAVFLAPDATLIRVGLAAAQIERNEAELLKPAIENLKIALAEDTKNAFAWRQLAIAYGRDRQMGRSWRALAEEALLIGRFDDAIGLSERAKRELKPSQPEWLRAEDIIAAAREGLEIQRR